MNTEMVLWILRTLLCLMGAGYISQEEADECLRGLGITIPKAQPRKAPRPAPRVEATPEADPPPPEAPAPTEDPGRASPPRATVATGNAICGINSRTGAPAKGRKGCGQPFHRDPTGSYKCRDCGDERNGPALGAAPKAPAPAPSADAARAAWEASQAARGARGNGAAPAPKAGRLAPRPCQECGGVFQPRDARQVRHGVKEGPACQAAAHARVERGRSERARS